MSGKYEFDDKALREKLEFLIEDDTEIKKWNEGLFIKSLILLPIIIFIIGLFILNRPEKLTDILLILIYPMALILIGLLFLFVMRSDLK
tara:strand:- start:320 stop:586 length:267 start_codon:yes stop_codon:yes gene_type:complete